MIILGILKALVCIILIAVGLHIGVVFNNILGILISASGLLALVAPIIIENDNFIDEQNKRYREGK